MTTLYFSPGACSLGPHILLEWIGQPYQAQKVKIGSPELKALNPTGAVPAIREDDGWVLTQASAIADYLAHKHPEVGLTGGDSLRERAEAHRWSSFVSSDLHAAFWPIFMAPRFTTDQSEAALAAVIEAAKQSVARRLDTLDAHLAGRDWILGAGKGKRSFVDAEVYPMLNWAKNVLPEGIAPWKNVSAFHQNLSADPAVQKVMAEEQAA